MTTEADPSLNCCCCCTWTRCKTDRELDSRRSTAHKFIHWQRANIFPGNIPVLDTRCTNCPSAIATHCYSWALRITFMQFTCHTSVDHKGSVGNNLGLIRHINSWPPLHLSPAPCQAIPCINCHFLPIQSTYITTSSLGCLQKPSQSI